MSKHLDLTAQVFGRLTLVEFLPGSRSSPGKWRCRCECGKEVVVRAADILKGHTQSCGCYNKQRIHDTKYVHGHGKDSSGIYSSWLHMRGRCLKPNNKDYKYYGGKGIKICDDWLTYTKFESWALTHGWQEGLTIERIDSNKDYCPENCEWITQSEQSRRRFKV